MLVMHNSHHRPRVAIIRNAYSYDFGGGERFPVSLAEELAKQGHETVIISRSPRLLSLAKERKLEVVQGWWWSYQNFSGRHSLLFPVYLLWQLALMVWYLVLFIRLKPSAVHPQSRDDFVAATLAAKLVGSRVVWTDHADLKYIFQNHRVWYKNPVGKLVYLSSKLAHHITLVSKSEKRLIEAQIGHTLPSKYIVIHNGVNDQYSKLKPAQTKKKSTVFVATSRLVTSKGIGELIDAFKSLSHSEKSELWLLGEGLEEKKFRQQAGDTTTIKFLGFPKNALQRVADADVFIHPSYHEGFSISLVEAAMLGKPIIACDVGGNGEIITNNRNGLLVAARDSEALRKAMLELLKNSTKRKKMGIESREIYLTDFVFSQIVEERFVPLYEK